MTNSSPDVSKTKGALLHALPGRKSHGALPVPSRMKETWRRGATVAGFIICAAATAAELRGQAPWPEPRTSVLLTVPCHPRVPEAEWSPMATCQVAGYLLEAQLNTAAPLAVAGRTSHGLMWAKKIEGREGSRSHAILGAAVGFVLGAGTTYFVLNGGGSTSKCDRSANQDAMSSGECLGAYVLGGVVGAGVGAGLGALIRTERWESLPLERLDVAVLPQRRVGVEATLKW